MMEVRSRRKQYFTDFQISSVTIHDTYLITKEAYYVYTEMKYGYGYEKQVDGGDAVGGWIPVKDRYT